MNKDCFVEVKSVWLKAEFIGVFQRSDVIAPSPMVGGHPGGVIAYPIAVVNLDGMFKEVKLSSVSFHKLG